MKWNERLVEWLIELDVKLQRDPFALCPALAGIICALLLCIIPGIAIGNLSLHAPMLDGMKSVFNILWAVAVVVGLLLLAQGVVATMARLEKTGRFPY
ncbi:hypothetical protein [Aeromonas media]|uniref:hypothetical protein n=1 Tax=Aeromonas media TaxID=651 RepID=UPI003D25C34B